jgi:hypothetical protein
MSTYDWSEQFHRIFGLATAACRSGQRDPAKMFSTKDVQQLARWGCSAQEMFDFADDSVRYGEPSGEMALLITAVRRAYFLEEMGGHSSGRTIAMDSLPAKDAELGGLRWLPRLIAKARAKLRGEMPAELMFGCSGDRAFLREVGWHPADFLRLVWTTGGDARQILERLKHR